MAFVALPPMSAGVALMQLQTLLISAGEMPVIGLVGLYEAPTHHWQNARGVPKPFLMAAMTGSDATQVLVAAEFLELVVLVFFELVDDFLVLVLIARATRFAEADSAAGMIGITPLISPLDCRASRLSTTALRF